MKEERLHPTGETARMLGVHFNTAKRWIYAGKLKEAAKTPGGNHRVSEEEVRRLLNKSTSRNRAAIYARVSSTDQKEDLKRQPETLQEGCDWIVASSNATRYVFRYRKPTRIIVTKDNRESSFSMDG